MSSLDFTDKADQRAIHPLYVTPATSRGQIGPMNLCFSSGFLGFDSAKTRTALFRAEIRRTARND